MVNNKPTKLERKAVRESKLASMNIMDVVEFKMFYTYLYSIVLNVKARGMNQTRFAELIGTSKSTLCDVQNGRRTITMKQLVQFSKLMKFNQREKIALYESVTV